jgi:cell division septal protein FtsQ
VKKFTLFQSLCSIILSTLFITPTVYTVGRYFQKKWQEHRTSPDYCIQAILQTSSIKRPLNSAFFAERLGLSSDMPQNIYRFDRKLAEKKLLETAVIKKVKVRKQYPNTLYVEYEMRIPLAKLGEYENVAIDQGGVAFPLVPFFARRKIPEIYLGEGVYSVSYNQPLRHPKLEAALAIIKALKEIVKEESVIIEKVDVSQIDSSSYGRREVVTVLKGDKGRHFLRLQMNNLDKELTNYLSLQNVLETGDKVIDLRIDNIAYIDKVGNG